MKNSNDLDFSLRDYAKENCVAACRKLFISLLNMIAGKPGLRVICKKEEGVIELLGISSTLLFAPFSLRVGGNRFQVGSSRIGKGICPH